MAGGVPSTVVDMAGAGGCMGSAQGGEGDGHPSSGTGAAALPPLLAAAFAAGGEMGERLGGFDWSGTPLGTPDTWPPALCHAVSTMLSSRAQIVMFWGEDHHAFYNDAYRPTIGDKHPAVLGQPAREYWRETWEVLGPLLDGVRRSGEPYRGENHPFLLNRHGFLEDVYFDVSYDPIREADGSVNGVICFVNETTGRVLGERRLSALAELGNELADVRSVRELGRAAARVLDAHRADVPFSAVWLYDEDDTPALAGWTGADPGALAGGPPPPGAGESVAHPRWVSVADLLGEVPPNAAERALVLPLTAPNEPAGVLLLGIARRLALTDDYRDFLDLVAAQISRAVGKQRAYEQERARAAELAALDRAKTNFFANVSHEFRTRSP